MYFSRTSWKLDPSQESFVYNLSKNNIGAAMAHRILISIQGGYSTRVEYRDGDGVLDAMFWADETAKYHYNMFGDVVSFDAFCYFIQSVYKIIHALS